MEIFYIPLDDEICILSVHNLNPSEHEIEYTDMLEVTGFTSLITNEELETYSPNLYDKIMNTTTVNDYIHIKQYTNNDQMFYRHAQIYDVGHKSVLVFNNQLVALFDDGRIKYNEILSYYIGMCDLFNNDKIIIDDTVFNDLNGTMMQEYPNELKQINRYKLLNVECERCTMFDESNMKYILNNDEYGASIETDYGIFNIFGFVLSGTELAVIDGDMIITQLEKWMNCGNILEHPTIQLLVARYLGHIKEAKYTTTVTVTPKLMNICNKPNIVIQQHLYSQIQDKK